MLDTQAKADHNPYLKKGTSYHFKQHAQVDGPDLVEMYVAGDDVIVAVDHADERSVLICGSASESVEE